MDRRDFMKLLGALPLTAPLEELIELDPTELTAEDVQEIIDEELETSTSCSHPSGGG